MGQRFIRQASAFAVTRDWSSRWFANSANYATMLNEDVRVRDYLKKLAMPRSVAS